MHTVCECVCVYVYAQCILYIFVVQKGSNPSGETNNYTPLCMNTLNYRMVVCFKVVVGPACLSILMCIYIYIHTYYKDHNLACTHKFSYTWPGQIPVYTICIHTYMYIYIYTVYIYILYIYYRILKISPNAKGSTSTHISTWLYV